MDFCLSGSLRIGPLPAAAVFAAMAGAADGFPEKYGGLYYELFMFCGTFRRGFHTSVYEGDCEMGRRFACGRWRGAGASGILRVQGAVWKAAIENAL